MKKKQPVLEIIEKAWINGDIYCEIPCSGHARNMVNRFRNKNGSIAHSYRMGKRVGVFFHDRIKDLQEKEDNKNGEGQRSSKNGTK